MRRWPGRSVCAALALWAGVGLVGVAGAQTGGSPGAPTPPEAVAARPAKPADPRVEQIRALMDGSLDVTVSPEALFDVPLDDEQAIEVEGARLRALRADAEAEPANVEPIDAARLAFYSLDEDAREELLAMHEARQEAARPKETEEERRVREAEAERQRALAAARLARTEAEGLVGQERLRLTKLQERVKSARKDFGELRQQIAGRRDIVLGWQRRIKDAKAQGPDSADVTYDAIRRNLRASRDDLALGLHRLSRGKTGIPALGPDALADVPADIPTDDVREQRAAVQRAIAAARRDEAALREEYAAALVDEVIALNRQRLGLLPYLSAGKRAAVTGFTAAGLDQAHSEARHLSLVLRYHRVVAEAWFASLREQGTAGIGPWGLARVSAPVLLLSAVFLWGRKRATALLALLHARLAAADRAKRRTSPSFERKVVRVLIRTHRPLGWIVFFTLLVWLLPARAREVTEVQLLSIALRMMLAGAFIVNLINALAAGSAGPALALDDDSVGRLRLRSLQLVGLTVVVFSLILVVTARLVGPGTIYSWVLSTCWFAAIPLFLVLVRWWRGTVFQRLDRARKKSPLQAWMLANRAGWKSFLAAMIGALQLFTTGAVKLVRRWLSRFDLARRIHAYLYKREIERLGGGTKQAELVPLAPEVLEHLHPERPHTRFLTCPSSDVLERLGPRISAGRGGLVAIVGARGMGKSSLLRALAAREAGSATVSCTAHTLPEMLSAELVAGKAPRAVLVDDAHALIRPCIGGLAKFDQVIASAWASRGITWVLAIDASVWPLLKRARDGRAMFDEVVHLEPWDETEIGTLLADRSKQASLQLTFADLLDQLPPGSDEVDLQDALSAKRAGYERMLWDHVGGNPGLALEAWRSSLGQDADGSVHVRPLQLPDVVRLEKLPDSSLFILRAVLQLLPADVAAVAEATRLPADEVLQDFRFGQAQGYFTEHEGQVAIAWPWVRAVTRLLERRHLLVPS